MGNGNGKGERRWDFEGLAEACQLPAFPLPAFSARHRSATQVAESGCDTEIRQLKAGS